MHKPLFFLALLSALTLSAHAEETNTAQPLKPLPPIAIEDVLQISAPEPLFTLAIQRCTRLAELLERVTDEKSAHAIAPDAERCYIELQLLDTRGGMLPGPTRELAQRMLPVVNKFREVRLRALRQCQRLEQTPRLAQLMDPVVRPLYLDLKFRLEATRHALLSELQTIRSQTELYKLQHNDKLPDFRKQGWSQLTKKTRGDGQTMDEGDYGPYLQNPPVNPLLNRSRILIARSTPKRDFHYAAGDCGFIIDESTGKIWAIDVDGNLFNENPALPTADLR